MGIFDVGNVLDTFGLGGAGGAQAAGRAGTLQAEARREAAGLQADAIRSLLPMLQERMGITEAQFQPFMSAGTGAISGLQRGFQAPGGTTAGGMEDVLSGIIRGDTFGSLIGERQRSVEGQLSAGGLTRSGTALTEAANIPTDLALQLENQLFGRQFGAEQERISGLETLFQGGLTSTAQGTAASGNLMQSIIAAITGAASAEAGGITGGAEAEASGILGAEQARAGALQNIMNLGGSLGAASILKFSDPRLKTNIRVIGKIGPLDLAEWEWIPELKDTIVNEFPTMGYLSTQVKELFPDLVEEFGGYDVINYPEVNERLSCH